MFSFIILHYKNIDDTIECLNCLKKISNTDSHIIVVDNNTLTNNEEKIIQKYTNDIIKLNKNYGFAKANNKAINYALNKYNSKYFIVINNDVFISQKNFLEIIDEDYKKYNFDMLGTYIFSPSKESVNPFNAIKSKEETILEIKKCNRLISMYKNPILYFLLITYLKIKYLFIKKNIPENGKVLQKNVALHGCAIIFSNKYVKKYEDSFFKDTFLFHEEEFLYQRIINDNLISVYDPNLKVFHKEGSSLKKSKKSDRLGKLFKEEERLKSLKLLLKEMDVKKNGQ